MKISSAEQISETEQDSNSGNQEMSKYIDLDLYHAVEKTHPFYLEMIEEIHKQVDATSNKNNDTKILELGAGTGLLTQELVQKHLTKLPKKITIDALEYDWKIYNILRKNLGDQVNCICGDAVKYLKPNYYDILVSSFAHDHIHFSLGTTFAKNIRNNLKLGGHYIMGGEILPYFTNEKSRVKSLYDYHLFIIVKALRDRHFDVAKLEIDALRSGADLIGDFKRHEKLFEEEMSNEFKLTEKIKIGPTTPANVGGVFVYVFQAI